MPVHDKDYRENFARSLFLTGKITQEAAYAISPRIKELRAASGDPITHYIDGPRGSFPSEKSQSHRGAQSDWLGPLDHRLRERTFHLSTTVGAGRWPWVQGELYDARRDRRARIKGQ